jgi:hypothetical protein
MRPNADFEVMELESFQLRADVAGGQTEERRARLGKALLRCRGLGIVEGNVFVANRECSA